MDSFREVASVCATIVIVLAIIFGGSLTYCNQLDQINAETVRRCIERGGSWVPTWSGNGACVLTR